MTSFALMLGLLMVPEEDRPQIMLGAKAFFDCGWPTCYFTVRMAARAGAGLYPTSYKSLASKSAYEAEMKILPALHRPQYCPAE